MRIRTIKPEFWGDEEVGAMTLASRLLFIASWNLADDEGILRWNPQYINSSVFAYDDFSPELVAEWMREIVDAKMVFSYLGGKSKQRLGFIVRFREHQRINRPQPGRLIPPSIQSRATKMMYGFRDRFRCGICGEEITEPHGDHMLSLDHIVPRSKGGTDHPTNIQSSHLSCNKSRGNKDLGRSLIGSLSDSVNDSWNDHGSITAGMEGNGKEWKGRDHAPARDQAQEDKGAGAIPGLIGDSLPDEDEADREAAPDVHPLVALCMELWPQWPQDQIEQSVLAWKSGGLKVTRKVLLDAKASFNPRKPYSDLHAWIARQAQFAARDAEKGHSVGRPQPEYKPMPDEPEETDEEREARIAERDRIIGGSDYAKMRTQTGGE